MELTWRDYPVGGGNEGHRATQRPGILQVLLETVPDSGSVTYTRRDRDCSRSW